MHSVEDANKLCHGRVEVRFGAENFQIEAKPDRAPRTDKQKEGGRVTNMVFGLAQQFASTIKFVGTPALGSYRRDNASGTYKRQLVLEPVDVQGGHPILPLFDIVYWESGTMLAVIPIEDSWANEHRAYIHWYPTILAAIAAVNSKFANRTEIGKHDFIRKKVLFEEDVATPPLTGQNGVQQVDGSLPPVQAAIAEPSSVPSTASANGEANGSGAGISDPNQEQSREKH